MKKTKIYILVCIYALSCIGVMVDFHYCGGKLESITLYQVDEKDCCGEEQEEEAGCCEDKCIILDTDNTEAIKSYTLQQNNFINCISPSYQVSTIVLYNSFIVEKNAIPLNHAPPNVVDQPLFIKNRILII